MHVLDFHYRVTPLIGKRDVAIADERMLREVCRYAAVQLLGKAPVWIAMLAPNQERAFKLALQVDDGMRCLGRVVGKRREGDPLVWGGGAKRLLIATASDEFKGGRFSWVLVDGVGKWEDDTFVYDSLSICTNSIVLVSTTVDPRVSEGCWV